MTSPSGPTWNLAATCARGLEGVLARELSELGLGPARVGVGVVGFSGGFHEVLLANVWLRTAMRVVVKVAEGRVDHRRHLYELARDIPWENWVSHTQTIAVEVAGRSRAFDNTAFAALVVKDALVDRVRDVRGERPDVDRVNPDFRVHVHLGDGKAGIGVDSSGEPLSHRGYRPRGGPAPMAESLAAGILLLGRYSGTEPLLDPMCGTGTLAIEAALLASKTAPGLNRSFACERWWFAASEAASVRGEADRVRMRPPRSITGSDADPRAVRAAAANSQAAGVEKWCRFERADARQLQGVSPGTLIVCNPPYGHRLGEREAVRKLYRDLGSAFRSGAPGSRALVLVGDRELARCFGLRPASRVELFNGPIRCVLLEFPLGAR